MASQDQHSSLADSYKEFGTSTKQGNPNQGVIHFNPEEVRVLNEDELSAYAAVAKVAWTSVIDTQRRFLKLIGIDEAQWLKYREQLSQRMLESMEERPVLLHGHTHSVTR